MLLNPRFEIEKELATFFDDWKKIQKNENELINKISLANSLDKFFKEWSRAYIDKLEWAKFFDEFLEIQKALDLDRKNGLKANVWTVSGLKKDERRNTDVLKWFLDCKGNHGQRASIFHQFLQLLPEPFCNFEPTTYSIVTESCPLGLNESRVDIEIVAEEFILFIEVKIGASEGVNQLQRYHDIAQAKSQAKQKQYLIVYLTRDGKLPSRHEHDNKYLGLKWSEVSRQFELYSAEISKQSRENNSIWLLSQFSEHIKNI